MIVLENDATPIEIILDLADFYHCYFNTITVLAMTQNYKNYGIAFLLKNEGDKKYASKFLNF
jgi:hypothetical protein